METILWLLSWIYINFPLCHLNKARIPVGIKIFATPSFYDHEKSRREVAPQHFHFQSKSASHAEVTPLCFYFRIHFPFSRYRRGQRSRHELFSPHIRHPTRATHERNSTAPAPFSPSLLDDINRPGRPSAHYTCIQHPSSVLLPIPIKGVPLASPFSATLQNAIHHPYLLLGPFYPHQPNST